MKINRMSWTNYKGLANGEIITDGMDVEISGRNGTGKSTIYSVLPFVLTGEGRREIKRYEDGLIPTDDGLTHGAEIEFDDGTTLRREYSWTKQGNQQKLFINDSAVNVAAFTAKVALMTGGGGELVFSLFSFCKLSRDAQRAKLLELFAPKIDMAQFAEAQEILQGMSPDRYIADTKRNVDRLKTQVSEIEPAITELQRQLVDVPSDVNGELEAIAQALTAATAEHRTITDAPDNADIKNLSVQIDRLRDERVNLKSTQVTKSDELLTAARRRVGELERQKDFYTHRLTAQRNARQRMRADYKSVANSKPGRCPTCGQTMPLDKFTAQRDERLKAIAEDGKSLNDEITELEQSAAQVDEELREANSRVAELERQATENATRNDERVERLAQIEAELEKLTAELNDAQLQQKIQRSEALSTVDAKIAALTEQRTILLSCSKVQARIQKLTNDAHDLNKQIALYEQRLILVKEFIHKKIRLVEEQINAHFEAVKFKLFDVLITTGEVKPTCEATLNGVPYSSLSKGERLRAALDIFRTLQAHFKVEMPLFIDDAESYTANSLVELPNQKFFFMVTDGDLTVTTDKARNAA